jgi:hypothetical protein
MIRFALLACLAIPSPGFSAHLQKLQCIADTEEESLEIKFQRVKAKNFLRINAEFQTNQLPAGASVDLVIAGQVVGVFTLADIGDGSGDVIGKFVFKGPAAKFPAKIERLTLASAGALSCNFKRGG